MKMNKILSMFMFVIALSALAIKSQAFTVDDLTVKTKESTGFSVTRAIKKPLNLIADDTVYCSSQVISFSPQSDQELSSFGGTFKGEITWSDYDDPYRCGLFGPIIARDQSRIIGHRFPGYEEATFSLGANNSLLSRTVPFRVGGKAMQIVQSGQFTDFSFLNWVRRKVKESNDGSGKCYGFLFDKCPNYAVLGVRG